MEANHFEEEEEMSDEVEGTDNSLFCKICVVLLLSILGVERAGML